MNEEEKDVQESENPEEEETSKNDEEEKDWKKMYEDQKIRAEKAERKAKEFKEKPVEKTSKKEEATSKNEPQLSVKDSAVLLENKIPTDDWDEVISYANYRGISIKEALGSSVVKATLSERSEERNSAKAANTGGGKRGSSKVSGDALLNKAMKDGSIPDSDEELDRLLEARYKPNS